jgi:hypothetical protein
MRTNVLCRRRKNFNRRAKPAAKVTTRAQWADRIKTAHMESVEAILNLGRLLIEAKDDLEYGDFTPPIKRETPHSAYALAQRLVAIAGRSAADRDNQAQQISLLPSSWSTLYELTRLPDADLERAFTEGRIHPDMQRADVQKLLPKPVVIDHDPEPSPEDQPEPAASTPEDGATQCTPELMQAVEAGDIPVSTAADLAREPVETQREVIKNLPCADDGKLTPTAKGRRRSQQEIEVERFENAVRIVEHTCENAAPIKIPAITAAQAK